MLLSGCVPTKPSEPTNLTADPSLNPNTVTIFLTGNTLSTLKPCGCTTGQLGGLDRRGGVIHSTPADRRLLIDTGNFLMQDTPQDRIKLGILLQALTLQEYDILHLDKNDLRVITEMGLLDSTNSKLFTSTPNDKIPAKTEREFTSGRPQAVGDDRFDPGRRFQRGRSCRNSLMQKEIRQKQIC